MTVTQGQDIRTELRMVCREAEAVGAGLDPVEDGRRVARVRSSLHVRTGPPQQPPVYERAGFFR